MHRHPALDITVSTVDELSRVNGLLQHVGRQTTARGANNQREEAGGGRDADLLKV